MSRVATVVALAASAGAQLTLSGLRCGQLTCQLGEYCSSETDRCAPCADICNATHHNYDAGLCVKECQDYIHDIRYVSRSEGAGVPPDFRSVAIQAKAALIISSVALAVLLLILVLVCVKLFRDKFTFKYLRQKLQPKVTLQNRVKQQTDLVHRNPHAEMAKGPKTELKLDIRPEPPQRAPQPLSARDLASRQSQTEKSHGATTPKTVSTVLSHRHPAEDTTLDYSYDNMGLNVTPPPAQPSASRNF